MELFISYKLNEVVCNTDVQSIIEKIHLFIEFSLRRNMFHLFYFILEASSVYLKRDLVISYQILGTFIFINFIIIKYYNDYFTQFSKKRKIV